MTGVVVSRFEGPAADWDEFVRLQRGWTHFHLYGWRDVIKRVFRHDCVYLVARDSSSSRIVGVLPLVRVRSVVFGHFLVSMPFVNYGGPLGTDDAVKALAAEAVTVAKRRGVRLLEMRSRVALPIDLPVSHRKLTVVLDLPADSAKLMAALPAKLRSQVRRPKKDGVYMKFGLDQLDAFYSVFAQHMRDLGTPAQSKAFFRAIADVFPNDVHFAVAYHQDQPIACGCGFLWNGEFEITWASALRSHKAMSPNMLVYFELMERMVAAGAHLFNFGRCSKDSGTYKFKMQWGGREEELWWYQQTRDADKGEASTPSPDQGIFAVATRVWQRLPLSVANQLGPRIVRSIP
ncbi:MAG TPA: FemAB family XrtA/PEP-CTERM system-associated protein [Gemmatimonadaceae bacterium]|nr:FemAB family XrtA/PEP-CTERM system-associated protein [Gemmatimonadaceae bacterium]